LTRNKVDSIQEQKIDNKQQITNLKGVGKMSLDVHSLMSIVDMGKLLRKSGNHNIQTKDLVRAMVMSEPCLFNNDKANLIPVTEVKLAPTGAPEK